MKLKNLLKIVLLIDAIITLGFGLFSWLNPMDTFGTIVAIPETENALVLAILSSMSVLYMLLGLVCLIGFRANNSTSVWIAWLMVLRHIWLGIAKVFDSGAEWVIGNPYPDIVIHGCFFAVYFLAILGKQRAEKKAENEM